MRLSRRTGLLGAAALLWPLPLPAFNIGIFVAEGGAQLGPFFDEADIKKHIPSKAEAATTLVWHQGMEAWKPAKDVPLLADLIAALPDETPFDGTAYILGTWRSEFAPIYVDGSLILGLSTLTFEPSGKVTFQERAEKINRLRKLVTPGEVKRDPISQTTSVTQPVYEWIDNSIRFSSVGDGTYKITGTDPKELSLAITMNLTSNTNGKTSTDQGRKSLDPLSVVSQDEFLLGPDKIPYQRR